MATWFGTKGDALGSGSFIGLLRDRKIGVVVLSLFAKPAHPRPVPPLAPLAGTFSNPSFGRAVRGQLNVVSLSFENNQTYEFSRE